MWVVFPEARWLLMTLIYLCPDIRLCWFARRIPALVLGAGWCCLRSRLFGLPRLGKSRTALSGRIFAFGKGPYRDCDGRESNPRPSPPGITPVTARPPGAIFVEVLHACRPRVWYSEIVPLLLERALRFKIIGLPYVFCQSGAIFTAWERSEERIEWRVRHRRRACWARVDEQCCVRISRRELKFM